MSYEAPLKEKISRRGAEAVALCAYMAEHPELPGQEREISRKMAELLKTAGYAVEYPYCGYETAFLAVLDNGEGPSAALLAEYDALPGLGHACGHNVHGPMSLLAGLVLAEIKEHFKGRVCVVGTPAEEADGAKTGMAAQGVFDGYDLALMFHSHTGGETQPAMNLLALGEYFFAFTGKSAHATACPWEGHNALSAARVFLDIIDAKRHAFTSDMRVNGVFTDGGRAPNIISEHAEIRMEVRAGTTARMNALLEEVYKCARAAALAFDCEAAWRPGFAPFADMIRNQPAEDAMQDILESLGMKVNPPSPAIGSSDVGNVSYCCPAIQPLLAITDEPLGLHTVEFARATTQPKAREALLIGAEALTLMTLKVLNDASLRRSIREEFENMKKRVEK